VSGKAPPTSLRGASSAARGDEAIQNEAEGWIASRSLALAVAMTKGDEDDF
jgi:hypothetical protein